MNLSRKIFAYSYLLSAGVLLTALSSCSDDYIVNTADETRLIRFNVSAASLESSSNQTATKGTRENALALLQLHGASNPLFLVPWIEDRAEASFENVNGDITRSILVDASNMESFGVYAGYASEAGSTTYKPNYMSNIEITRASGWMPHDEYLWPGEDALHFNAYSPYFSGSATDGITGINSSSGVLSLDYVTPAEVADQKDLLYATPVEASSSPCNLSFNHALTAVRFVTGAEMAQCTIRSIAITNVESNGKLNLESGEWTDLSSTSDFSVSPEISLVAEENSNFVAPETPITSDEQTFLLIPQKLRSEAAIKILIESNGNESELTASLDSQSLPEGKIVTYRISANPESDSLILDVKGSFNSEYTGSNLSFNVKSSYNDGGVATPVNWTAEFVDDNGNVISQPYWISDFTLSGSGNTEGKISTVMQDIVFEKMSSQTRVLQDATDINSSSGHNPFNLSSSTGAANVENTANTYVINAPGSYMLPLVYG
ncbi:MAG: fimbrillin family protein, partial [Muribaculaceae bacterium]|nr:fimbrillin family protein [Muribaculaceae bacterium]